MLKRISVDKIDEPTLDTRAFRSELFEERLLVDVSQEGVLTYPVVRVLGERYEILDGVTRIRALRAMGETSIICDVRLNVSDTDACVFALKTSIIRQRQDAIGMANVFKFLKEKGLKHREIAERFGYSSSHISKILSLLELNPEQQLDISKGNLSIEEGYAIAHSLRYKTREFERDMTKCFACSASYPSYDVQSTKLCFNCRSLLALAISSKREADKKEAEARARLDATAQQKLS